MPKQIELKEETKPQEVKKPVRSFRAGGVCADVWENENVIQQGNTNIKTTFETVNIQRTYKDKQGEWKKTSTFRKNDLPKVALVAQKAFEYVILNAKDVQDDD